MKLLHVTLILGTLVSSVSRAGTPEDTLNLFPPCKDNNLQGFINENTGYGFKDYADPTQLKINRTGEVLRALEANDPGAIGAAMGVLNLEGCRFSGELSDVIFVKAPRQHLEIAFFWRVGAMKVPGDPSTLSNPVDPLVLEDPHEGSDGTFKAASTLFARTRARILLVNTAHKSSSNKNATCQGEHKISDGAHSMATLFHKAHSRLSMLYPKAFFVQLHGMADSDLLIANGFNSRFTQTAKSGPTLFMDAVPTHFDPAQYSKMKFCTPNDDFLERSGCHNTNVQGRQLNGGHQCDKGVADRGRFMHMEMGPNYRLEGSEGKLERLADTLNLAMEGWVQTE